MEASEKYIVILDDEEDRLVAMRKVLSKKLTNYQVNTFKTAPSIIDWLKANLTSVALISLDHDLVPESPADPDPGTGREVADYLMNQSPICPVIIHSTNSIAASGMEWVLSEAKWSVSRVVPYQHLTWVKSWWIKEVVELIQE